MTGNNSTNTTIDSDYINYNEITYGKSYGYLINIHTKSGMFYLFVNFFIIIFYIVPLIWILKFKNWFVFRQRNFILTFIGGIANFFSTVSNSITPILMIPCSFAYYCATIATVLMQICYVFRAFRLIILYRLNIFKVTILDQDKFIKKSETDALIEPNIYYKSIYKLVNKKLAKIILTTILTIVTVVSIAFHIITNVKNKQFGFICGIRPVNINSRITSENYGVDYMDRMRHNPNVKMSDEISTFSLMHDMFKIPDVLSLLFTLVCLVITFIFTFTKIKDDQRFGIRFDCFSSAIISILIGVFYFYLKSTKDNILLDSNEHNLLTSYQIYLRSKQGIIFFVAIGLYIQLTSVVIPLIQCLQIERLNKKFKDESVNTIECFYKVLKSPKLVEELKLIAIQEFSVENVLFWENYCTLHKLVKRVVYHHVRQDPGDKGIEYYSLFTIEDIVYNASHSDITASTIDSEFYDPNYPLLPQLVPYFDSFYYTFIDIEGPAAVNLSADVVSRINNNFDSYPSVGIFDEAKKEIVEMMFFSIYPIFLRQNKDQLGEIFKEES